MILPLLVIMDQLIQIQLNLISGITNGIHNQKVIKIPSSEDNYEHKISVVKGTQNLTKTDYWKVAVTFVNYSDSEVTGGKADQQLNTNKTYEATLKFTPLESCSVTP